MASPRPQIIAHRGASGYLPEHTLVAKALAFAMGADYLEQDVVATRDGQLIVFHDLTLDEMTDVRARFPDRARPDGHYYCVDFSLEEVRSLSVTERRAAGGSGPRYPGRFPQRAGRFPIPTLDEEIRFIQGLAQSTGRSVGIYPEIKHPAWHRRHGIDLGAELLATLGRFGYTDARHDVFVQCFDPDELQRLRRDLGCRLRLVQLLEGQGDAPPRAALDRIAGYADAIGPSIRLLYHGRHPSDASPILTSLAGDARSAGLAVHPYTFRVDELPAGIDSFQDLLELFLVRMRVDGLFTDFPDVAARFVADRLPGR